MTGSGTIRTADAASTWRRRLHEPGWVVLPLRAFLGFTFVYAGIQKLADQSFFDAHAPTGIAHQLAAVQGSPIQGIVGVASSHALLFGLAIALGELAVGLGALLGLWTRVAAVGGALLSLGFLLTVSWQTDPFYYSPDIVFLVAWLPLVATGDGGVLSVGAWLREEARKDAHAPVAGLVPIEFSTIRTVCGVYDSGQCRSRRTACAPAICPVLERSADVPAAVVADIDRRTFLSQAKVAGAVAAGALVVGGATAAVGRVLGGPSSSADDLGTASARAAAPTAGPTTTAAASGPSTSAAAPTGKLLGAASKVPIGGAASFKDPKTMDAGVVVQPKAGTFVAFDASCTHQGCPVQYSKGSSSLTCPCHGAQFDASTGAVLRGPARRPLAKIPIALGPDGNLYVDG